MCCAEVSKEVGVVAGDEVTVAVKNQGAAINDERDHDSTMASVDMSGALHYASQGL